jgi:uncharacterized protein (TIGR02145 family)
MAKNDVLHMLILDENGTPVTVELIGDETTPSAPGQVTAIDATNITDSGFTANWLLTENADGYYFNLATDPDMTPHISGYENLDVENVNHVDITGLTPGVVYYYQVSAYNNIGEGLESNIISTLILSAVLLEDLDGNEYHTIVIGNQEWIVENLKVTQYADTSIIPNVTIDADWAALTAIDNKDTYGGIYNWYAATDARNIAPVGWHVPTFAEAVVLQYAIGAIDDQEYEGPGYDTTIGQVLREIGTTYWITDDGTDTKGFHARGSGRRNYDSGNFEAIKALFVFWLSDAGPLGALQSVRISDDNTYYIEELTAGVGQEAQGYSIRLIKDDSTDPGTVTGNDGKVYTTVKIGDQVWMAENSAETKYQNGDLVTVVTDDTTWAAETSEAMCYYDNIALSDGDAYCWYNNDLATYKAIYGALYNDYAVLSAKELVYFTRSAVHELGWRVATKTDWDDLIAVLDGLTVAGGRLKEIGTTHWTPPNTGAIDSVEFKAVGGGYRQETGTFGGIRDSAFFWTSTSEGLLSGVNFYLNYDTQDINHVNTVKGAGYSVRCVRDIYTSTVYVIYTDGISTWRKGVRSHAFVLDKTITPLGFSGVEDTDWVNIKSVKLD